MKTRPANPGGTIQKKREFMKPIKLNKWMLGAAAALAMVFAAPATAQARPWHHHHWHHHYYGYYGPYNGYYGYPYGYYYGPGYYYPPGPGVTVSFGGRWHRW